MTVDFVSLVSSRGSRDNYVVLVIVLVKQAMRKRVLTGPGRKQNLKVLHNDVNFVFVPTDCLLRQEGSSLKTPLRKEVQSWGRGV